jgi:Na+/phosphate symporter
MMTNIFEKTFDPEWMNENKKIENSHKDQKAIDKYQQKVKDYTSYLIGRKISENTRLYT